MRNISTLICLGLALSVTACVPDFHEEPQWMPWQLATERQEHVIELNFTNGQFDLSAVQSKTILQAKKMLAGKTACHAVININHENIDSQRHVHSLVAFLRTIGINSQHIKVQNLSSFADKASELSLILEEYEAVIPRCPGWIQPMTSTFDQNAGPGGELNFGCTTQYNLSRMIAHPKDIVEPQKLGAGSGQYLGKIVDDLAKNKMSDSAKKSTSTSGSSSTDTPNN